MATNIDLDEVNVGEVLDWMEKNDCEEFSFGKTRELTERGWFDVSKKELLSLSRNDDFCDFTNEGDFNNTWDGHLGSDNWDCCAEMSNEYYSSPTITKKVKNKDEVIKELELKIVSLETTITKLKNEMCKLEGEVQELSELRVA
jgi:hypothetical protein